jgi:hypothetical protein
MTAIKGWDMDIRDMFPVRFSEPVDDTGEMTWGPTQRDQFHIDDVASMSRLYYPPPEKGLLIYT